MNKIIKTRIAPSPTGFLHIGTARTALFNYLFARQNKGQFVLRIEDTDKARSKPEYEEDIINGLKWLDLNWDEEIVRQSDRTDRHLQQANRLVEMGVAYEKDGAIWFKVPQDQEIKFNDLIRGEVSFQSNDLEDFVIIRSDGSPIFYLVGIVDDHDMGITHVIRGEDLLSNTPKQILIARALGYSELTYAHLPLIFNTDRTKLSKRHGAAALTDYQKDYLPSTLINFLGLLGWHPSDDREIFSLEDLVSDFQINRVSKSPAIFDIDKLNSINNYYIKNMDNGDLQNLLLPYKPKNISEDRFQKAVPILKDRLAKLSQFESLASVFGNINDYDSDLLIFKKSTKEKTLLSLSIILDLLPITDCESMVSIEDVLSKIVKDNNLTNGDVYWPVRVALSGLEKSPSPIEMLWVLGPEESIKRIEKAINKLK
jgi:glutamyl-tRNA synthetase